VPTVEWRCRIIFDTELNGAGGSFAGNFGDDAQSEVDPGGDASGRGQIAVFDDSRLLVRRADER